MCIVKHHFEHNGNKVDVYYYEDRYRYCVHTNAGLEYREIKINSNLAEMIDTLEGLEALIVEDINLWPYKEQQLKVKCVRCSKPFGAPRKEYNLSPICNRCFEAMSDMTVSESMVWYEITADGSKGSVIK